MNESMRPDTVQDQVTASMQPNDTVLLSEVVAEAQLALSVLRHPGAGALLLNLKYQLLWM